jgi:hypothetical protein
MNKNFWIIPFLILAITSCGRSKKHDEENAQTQSSFYFLFQAEVKGLSGTLRLSNLGDHSVMIGKNGLVTFPSTWTQKGNYEIKVEDEPCAQRCVVDKPIGQITTQGSLTLSISCSPKTWDYPLTPAEAISLPNTKALSPKAILNRSGDMLLTWYQSDYYTWQFYKSMYKNREWQKPNSITDHFSFTGSDGGDQFSTINDDDQASILWTQIDGTNRNLYVGDYEDKSWTFPSSSSQVLNVGGYSLGDYNPIIRSNALGEKIAVWSQTSGANIRLYKAEFRNGSWSFPTNLIDNISPDGTDVAWIDAAMDDVGNIIIVWQQSNGSYQQIFKSEYHNGIWTHPTSLQDRVSYSGADAFEPHVAMNNVGDAYIVWYQHDHGLPDRYQVFVSGYHQGIWTIPTYLGDNISPNGKQSEYPQVVVNDMGLAAIASMYRVNDSINVYQMAIQQKIPGGAWSSPMILTTTDASNDPTRPQIDMDEQGNILVAWALQNSGQVYKAEYRNGVWSLASLANPVNFMPSTYDYPSVSVNNCRAALAWQQINDAGVEQVYVAQYH